jgi:carbamoyl-phosphate synthase large subunit
VEDVHAVTKYEPWFLRQIAEIIAEEKRINVEGLPIDAAGLRRLKAMGFSDKRLATLAVRSVGVAGKTLRAIPRRALS